MSKTIAIIPARGGSKRLPKKNLLKLDGLPLLVHSINYAMANSDIINEVVVSTDDPDIQQIALQHGARVVRRPDELSGDDAPTITALQHVLEKFDSEIEDVILLQATNPLRPENLLKGAWSTYLEGYDSLMTITPNLQKFGRLKNGKFEPYNYSFGQRSQDMEPLYFENGLLYIAKAKLVQDGKLLADNHHAYIVEHPYATVDIDDANDLAYAEFVLKNHSR